MNNYTDYQARYFAEQLLLKRTGSSIENISATLAGARVDLNPHQVDAALFAFASPLSQGVLLADEVGLGKTIEAGIVISQFFAEHKRKILLIVPASLRNQWLSELDDKFFLKSTILESKNFNAQKKKGVVNPFDIADNIVICSYNFASLKREELSRVDWDLVVIDEAHRLRNVYKPSNVTSNNLKKALSGKRKLLLTATPLQNNLMELYGLVSILDEKVFSDPKTFREKYVNNLNFEIRNHYLKEKIAPFCKRTLRKQVTEYIPYTKREAILTEYHPTKEEELLYNSVSAYLQSDVLYALPNSQRRLMTLILRKLLASSSFAIASTLEALVVRLEKLQDGIETELNLSDYDTIEELLEETNEAENETILDTIADREAIIKELDQVKEFAKLAKSINFNAKGDNLLTALEKGFSRTEQLGGNRKVVIFTESRRTQEYLLNLLSNNGYEGKILFLNGTNSDPISKEIYKKWVEKHKGEDIVSGSRTADIKAAIVEEFRENAEILIGTEAAAEGINLQFCSLLVNYDMPWNPQRIEQRIGRCHRYGQKNDVVVLNFVNKNNEADIRVYELLNEKFSLFDGLFGSSDEILGSIESGVDFENRIAEIYQHCRTTEEIQEAFDELQDTYRDKIDANITKTRQTLLENFDEDVSRLLKICNDETINSLNKYEQWLYYFILSACFENFTPTTDTQFSDKIGFLYDINWKKCQNSHAHFLRKDHYVVESNLNSIMQKELSQAFLTFNYSTSNRKISFLENVDSKKGYLTLHKVTHDGFEIEQHLLAVGILDNGTQLDIEIIQKLFELPATVQDTNTENLPQVLNEVLLVEQQRLMDDISARNKKFFIDECNKLNNWGEELKDRLQEEIKALDKAIKELKKDIQLNEALYDLTQIIEKQDEVQKLTKERSRKRANLFEEEDKIEDDIAKLQADVQKRMNAQTNYEHIFSIGFEVM